MAGILSEQTLSLSQAARRLPPGRRGRPVTLSCLLRWVLHGAPDPAGQLVRLEALRVGGRWLTSVEALERFGQRLTPNLDTQEVTPAARALAVRERAAERARRELEKLGVGAR